MSPRIATSLKLLVKAAALAAALAACSPSESSDPRRAAGTWPPKDYNEFAARPPMSVGRELEDDWTMAIEAERWSYLIGVAIVAAGGTPPPDVETAASVFEGRTANGLRDAAQRLIVLYDLTCRAHAIAKQADCVSFAPPRWAASAAPVSRDELQARLQWFEAHAYKFVHPACAVAIKRTGDERYCSVE
jgi:hypothetical protein